MTYLHSGLFIIHILFGSAALILFWLPMAMKKGGQLHKRFGNIYKNVMYVVAGSGAVMALLVLAMPLVIKHEYAEYENSAQIAENLRTFWAFLLYLALLSYTSTRHAYAVLQVKDQVKKLRTFWYIAPLALLLLGGVACGYIGVVKNSTLHIVFGILGTFVAIGTLKYIYKSTHKPGEYLMEHIGSIIGSGIGAYTAFIAFGARSLLGNIGAYQVIFWVAPGVIGTIMVYVLCKKYARIFGLDTSRNNPDASQKLNDSVSH